MLRHPWAVNRVFVHRLQFIEADRARSESINDSLLGVRDGYLNPCGEGAANDCYYEEPQTNDASGASTNKGGDGNKGSTGDGEQAKEEGAERKTAQGKTRRGAGVPADPLLREDRWQKNWSRDGRGVEWEKVSTYSLSPEAKKLLDPIFKNFDFDPSSVRFSFGLTPKGVAAYTIGNDVILNEKAWSGPGMTGLDRLALVAHEMTHSAQYKELGGIHFVARYAGEYSRKDNYQVPPSLSTTAFDRVRLTDPRFTLDQTAERVAEEVELRYGR